MAAVEEGVADEENVANDEDTLLEGDIAEPIEEEVREPLPPLTPIVFGVPKLKEGSAVSGALIQERERHLQRSQKFGVDYVEPKKELAVSRAELRTELARQRAKGHTGFATGIDLFSEEELAKKRVRAHKFQLATGEEAPADREARERAERQEKARKRIERFGKPDNDSLATAAEPPADPMEADILEARVDVAAGIPVRPEAVHVYGTDQMSTREVLAYFQGYGPSFVEWINDSSCNVVFADAFSAKRAMLGLGDLEEPPPAPAAAAADTADAPAAAAAAAAPPQGLSFLPLHPPSPIRPPS